MFSENIKKTLFCYFLFTNVQALGYTERSTNDLPSTRANTLSDDADDIQKQLDNEASDKMKYGRPKTIWILHFPTYYHGISQTESIRSPRNQDQHKEPGPRIGIKPLSELGTADWSYIDQDKWYLSYPECGGKSQSPVNVPTKGMVETKASRKMLFSMYDVVPDQMMVVNDGKTVSLFGNWDEVSKRPVVYGGAAHSRRYVFHSLSLRFPSEHTVGGLYYPMETQAVHVSAEYNTIEEAIKAASRDKLALLVVANIYKHSDHNHEGLEKLVKTVLSTSYGDRPIDAKPLNLFSPPLIQYAAYHGSLTIPPCTESVLWLVRARSLPIKRELAEALENHTANCEPRQVFHRLVQPLNDRKVYFFH